MKPAREVAHDSVAGLESKCRAAMRDCNDEHSSFCDDVTFCIESARREGAEWMREQAAMAADPKSGWAGGPSALARGIAAAIRALPLEPQP